MKSTDKPQAVDRRGFLRSVGGASVAAGTIAVGAAAPAAAAENDTEKKKARYKETEHVKKFYQVNRYP